MVWEWVKAAADLKLIHYPTTALVVIRSQGISCVHIHESVHVVCLECACMCYHNVLVKLSMHLQHACALRIPTTR